MEPYQIRQCTNPACGLRYPLVCGHPYGEACPGCRGKTQLVMEQPLFVEPNACLQKNQVNLEGFLDNIRSAWNVGSMLRSADGAGFEHLYLAGLTPAGDHPKVIKTALGAEKNIAWSVHRNGLEEARSLLLSGRRLWALETGERAVSIFEMEPPAPSIQIVLVVGNEITGIDPDILALCERVIRLPMVGVKRSYNAAVAFGIAAHILTFSPSRVVKGG